MRHAERDADRDDVQDDERRRRPPEVSPGLQLEGHAGEIRALCLRAVQRQGLVRSARRLQRTEGERPATQVLNSEVVDHDVGIEGASLEMGAARVAQADRLRHPSMRPPPERAILQDLHRERPRGAAPRLPRSARTDARTRPWLEAARHRGFARLRAQRRETVQADARFPLHSRATDRAGGSQAAAPRRSSSRSEASRLELSRCQWPRGSAHARREPARPSPAADLRAHWPSTA